MNVSRVKAACVQLSPQGHRAANIEAAADAVRAAAGAGAQFVLLPEHATLLHASGRAMADGATPEADDPALRILRETAESTGVWLLIGSLTLRSEPDARVVNRSVLVSDTGRIVARYDKLHMFDATLPSGRVLRESSVYRPGDRAVVALSPWGQVGLSICYDVRFPQLYRAMARAGARMLVIPSAFTADTGMLHWHTLVRARAIESACWVLAPATCGTHPGGHRTYGHSLIVDPSGRIVAEGGEEACIVMHDIDLGAVVDARGRLPSLEHDRDFELPDTVARASGINAQVVQ